MKKFFALSLAVLLALGAVSCGSDKAEEKEQEVIDEVQDSNEADTDEQKEEDSVETETNFVDGNHLGEIEEDGKLFTAEVTVEGGAITAVLLDEIIEGNSVRGVEVNTASPTVGDHLDALAQAVVDTQNNVVVNADGLADGVTACTMKANVYLNAVEVALTNATEEEATEEEATEEATEGLTDGVYTGETEPNSKGMSMYAEVTVAGGEITKVFLDELGADGSVREVEVNTASVTVGGHLDALAEEIVATQNNVVVVDGLADGVTACTMYADPYIEAVNIALAQAK